MSDVVILDNFCESKRCEYCIDWSFTDDEYEYPCTSCTKVGQSYNIIEIPPDCPYRDEAMEYQSKYRKEKQ